MKPIVINAISVREGGSLVVLKALLGEMVKLRPQWQWHVITNPVAVNQLPLAGAVHYHVQQIAGWRVRWWYEIDLPALVLKLDAALLYSQTNYLPQRQLHCPTLLLVQHAGHFSSVFSRLMEIETGSLLGRWMWRLKSRWVKNSVRRATRLTVQTRVLAQEVAELTGVDPDKISVIPHGPGLRSLRQTLPAPPTQGTTFRIGYITKAGVQKNFEVVLEALVALKKQGVQCLLILTLDVAIAGNRAVLEKAASLGVLSQIENHGEVGAAAIDALYENLHCFVFASLCESFGFPLVEAMAAALPVCVADTGSNREVSGEAGLPFAAHDAQALAALLRRLSEDAEFYLQSAKASKRQAAHYSWKLAGERNIQLIESMLSQAGAAL